MSNFKKPERSEGFQSTSTAWRPWYHPQLGQTTWGTFTTPQRGQRLRDGRLRRQFAARRLRPFALEVFFLGTAMAVQPQMRVPGGRWIGRKGVVEGKRVSDV